jgi:hypothetical protein
MNYVVSQERCSVEFPTAAINLENHRTQDNIYRLDSGPELDRFPCITRLTINRLFEGEKA